MRCSGPYLTLSYHWQSNPSLPLVTSPFRAMVKGFPTSNMPEAFQNAANVCHGLDIGFLWIDALCIIQGLADQFDWQRDFLQIDKIHPNALLDISAIAAADGSCSFFVDRHPIILPEVIGSNTIDGGKKKAISKTLLLALRSRLGGSQRPCWVSQERLLA